MCAKHVLKRICISSTNLHAFFWKNCILNQLHFQEYETELILSAKVSVVFQLAYNIIFDLLLS